ncbi:uncharacterized protein VTP21DRAFT_8794 [Calcarisporiella thermophila]|uniref:uncharacterized protein n=1 Tax=Calcarisporiella thermophila TaxID=911321 RepID=UPI003743F017
MRAFGIEQWHTVLFLLLLVATLFVSLVDGDSQTDRPLSRIEFVAQPTFKILPRLNTESSQLHKRSSLPLEENLQHDDAVLLRFRAYGRIFHLHLEPNLDLLHPDASFAIHDPETGAVKWEPLRAEDHLVYKGWVADDHNTHQWYERDAIGIVREENEKWREGALGWARIVVHKDSSRPTFEGAFTHMGELYHVKPIETYSLTKRSEDPSVQHLFARGSEQSAATMVIYRDSDTVPEALMKRDTAIMGPSLSCAMDELKYNHVLRSVPLEQRFSSLIGAPIQHDNYLPLDYTFSPLERRKPLLSTFPSLSLERRAPAPPRQLAATGSQGCPTSKRIAYIGVAADCTYVRSYTNVENARRQIITDFNQASQVFEQAFNVALGVITIDTRPPPCTNGADKNATWNRDCSDAYNINQRLSDFSQWRGSLGEDGAALWHLMTQCNSKSRVGIAWLGQLCTSSASKNGGSSGDSIEMSGDEFVSGTGVSSITRDEWKVVAHEIGHGFGAQHDCTSADCPCPRPGEPHCSRCCSATPQCDANGQFLMNPTSNTSTNQFSPCSLGEVCGTIPSKGFCLQPPGLRRTEKLAMCGNGILEEGEQCDAGQQGSECCNPDCTLKPGAVCSDANSECCEKCQLKPANTVCRPAISSCDIPETCNGTSPMCPDDKRVPDGTDCGANGLKCASGQCTSRDQQCASRGNMGGGRANLTTACNFQDGSCAITCNDPGRPGTCIRLSGNFIDGTPCGYGGKCFHGQCQTGNVLDVVRDWFNQNKQIGIPVVVALGLLILLVLFRCVYLCFQRKPASKPIAVPVALTPMPHYPATPSHYPPPPPPPPAAYNANMGRESGATSTGWVDPMPYNGPYGAPPVYRSPTPNSNTHYSNHTPMPEPYSQQYPPQASPHSFTQRRGSSAPVTEHRPDGIDHSGYSPYNPPEPFSPSPPPIPSPTPPLPPPPPPHRHQRHPPGSPPPAGNTN